MEQANGLQHVALPAITVDQQARISHWNRQAAELFELSDQEALGMEWHSAVRTIGTKGCCALCMTRAALRLGQSIGPVEVTVTVNGCQRRVMMIPMPSGLRADASISFLVVSEDLVSTREAEPRSPIHFQSRVRQLNNDRMIDELTPREREILSCITDGYDARGIAAQLGLSHATARNYVQRILSKLGARNKAEAVSLALRYNLLAS